MSPALEPERVYHLYTHANGSENLFREKENYRYFLKKYAEHIHPVVETYAYCLMPNHLHLMIRVRKEVEIRRVPDLTGFENLSGLVSRQFSKLFNAYLKAVNKKYDRKGSLFQRPFKRKPILDDAYFTALIAYIHNNPVHHGFVETPDDWPHSSWHAYLPGKPSRLAKEEALAWFGGKEEFVKFHRLQQERGVIMDFE